MKRVLTISLLTSALSSTGLLAQSVSGTLGPGSIGTTFYSHSRLITGDTLRVRAMLMNTGAKPFPWSGSCAVRLSGIPGAELIPREDTCEHPIRELAPGDSVVAERRLVIRTTPPGKYKLRESFGTGGETHSIEVLDSSQASKPRAEVVATRRGLPIVVLADSQALGDLRLHRLLFLVRYAAAETDLMVYPIAPELPGFQPSLRYAQMTIYRDSTGTRRVELGMAAGPFDPKQALLGCGVGFGTTSRQDDIDLTIELSLKLKEFFERVAQNRC